MSTTTHKVERDRGPVVVAGQVRYLTPTVIAAGDDTQAGGCQRRWWFRHVLRKEEPETPAQSRGTEVHAEIERYLLTGRRALGSLASAGARFIPERGPHLHVEHDLELGVLDVDGVQVHGHSDLISVSRHHLNADGEVSTDPEGTVEVVDWKSTSSIDDYARQSWQVADLTQMVAYGEYAARKWHADWVRLSHVYFQTRGRARSEKRTILVRRADLAPRWNRVADVGRSLLRLPTVDDQDHVPANTRACGDYRGCPHRRYCSAGGQSALDQVFGGVGAMNLLESLKQSKAAMTAAPPPSVSADLKSQVDALKAEEEAARAARNAVPPEFAAAVDAILAARTPAGEPWGQPYLTGEAARLWARHKGWEMEGGGLAGSGALASYTLSDPSQVLQVAGFLAENATPSDPTPPPAVVGLLSPETPESRPDLAADPVEGRASPPPNTPNPAPAPPPKRGRPPKASSVPAAPDKGAGADPTSVPAPAPAVESLSLFVDCFPSVATRDLHGYAAELCAALCKQYDAVDVRCAPVDGPLGYGKWKGALAALVRATPPGPGAYVIDARGSEVMEVVADALRPTCTLFVRGVK